MLGAVEFVSLGTVGVVAPLLYLLSRILLAPAHDVVAMRRATKSAYHAFLGVGFTTLVFVIAMAILLASAGRDWELGLRVSFPLIRPPLFLLLLVLIFFGLYQCINAKRDREFVLIALHTSLMFMASMFVFYSGPAFLASATVIISYPMVCIFFAQRGLKRLAMVG